MPVPFFVFLKKEHIVDKLTSYTDTEHARELQALVTSGDKATYRKKIAEYKELGEEFRLTQGTVYQMKEEGEKVKIKIALQVKGNSLTWYFWAPGAMDQYPQEFRDKLYNAAALAHKEVVNGCDLYYRGSNAFHVKRMHHLEGEAAHNHNHYRLEDGKFYTPEDVNQHLRALAKSEVHDLFFEAGEIDELCERYADFYMRWTAKVDGQPSQEEQYFSQASQQFDAADVLELNMFGTMQEPCRVNASELKIDYDKAREDIEKTLKGGSSPDLLTDALQELEKQYKELLAYRNIGGSRGLNASIANTRQLKGSTLPVVKDMGKDDSLGKEVPDIPKWAVTVQAAVDNAKEKMLTNAIKRTAEEERDKVSIPNIRFFAPAPDKKSSEKKDLDDVNVTGSGLNNRQ